MNKNLLKIFIIFLITAIITGCGSTTNDKAYKDAFKRSFNDDAAELEDDYDIEYALFSNNWMVRIEQRARLAELLKRMVSKKGKYVEIQVLEGYFTFSTRSGREGYGLDIAAYCLVDGEERWLFIDCGSAYVYSKYLYLDKKWYLSLQDKDKKDVEEPWAWCDYDKGEIDDSFWRPHFVYCSENYMYMENGVYLKSY